MVYGGDSGSEQAPAQAGEARFDPEATQVVPEIPAPEPRPTQYQFPERAPYGQPAQYGQAPPYGQPPPHGQPAPYGQSPYHPPATTMPVPPPAPAPPWPPSPRTALLIGIAVLALLVGGGIGVALLVNGPEPKETAAPAPEPSAPSVTASPTEAPSPASTGSAQIDIGARSTDPKPLTVAEIFPGQTVSFNGSTYRIHGTEATSNCKNGAYGQLATALGTAGCSQIVRATVADPSSQYLVTVGIANLPTQAAADDIYELLEDPAKNGYFTRLSGTGPAKDFASSRDTVIGSLARGHYVIFAIGGRAGGTGASLADEQLKTALKDLRLYANETLTARST